MPVVTELPSGLEEKDFKGNSPDRQLGVKTPPIQFIPSKIPRARTQEEKTTLKLTFPSGITKTFRVFYAGDLEHAINHVRLVEGIFKDMQFEEQILATEAKSKEKHQELVLLVPSSGRSRSDTPARHHRFQAEESSPESTENVSENVSQGNIETLKIEILELKGKIKDLNEGVF